jgi:aspartate-semialdehyde dehydrogenase
VDSNGTGRAGGRGERRGSDGRIPVGVLGATGSVGQRMIRLLEHHPWFRIGFLAASERSAGLTYREAVRWVQDGPIPEEAAGMTVHAAGDGPPAGYGALAGGGAPSGGASSQPHSAGRPVGLVLSALDASVAGEVEQAFADAGTLVVSNARNHRMRPDVPLIVPEVNPGHLALLERQPTAPGGIVTNPNCSTIGLVLALHPLDLAFGVRSVNVVTMQAVSGAGVPGVSSMEILDNVIPYIGGEEEKLERETCKILGRLGAQGIEAAGVTVSAQCNRVPVVDGHLLCVSVGLEREATPDEVAAAMAEYRGRPQELDLPSAPRRPLHVLTGQADPQPRLHRNLDRGMAVAVGRGRPLPLLPLRPFMLSPNTLRGAAGGALLAAELAVAEGRVPGFGVPD